MRIQGSLMPEGLDPSERLAYHRGWDRAAKAYAKKHGVPSVIGPTPGKGEPGRAAFVMELRRITREYNEDREPLAHKGGMAGLNAYRRKKGIEVPRAPRARKKAVCCPNCGIEVAA